MQVAMKRITLMQLKKKTWRHGLIVGRKRTPRMVLFQGGGECNIQVLTLELYM
jgi:hypothetical protein